MDKSIVTGETMAIIPARGGSKGVPHKNIKLLGGFPLIAYTIVACKLSKEINRVVVSTDDKEIANIAMEYGAEVPFFRPAELAADNSGDIEFVNHAINWFTEHGGKLPEFFVHMRPTTPLRENVVIDRAIKQLKQDESATSLRSAHEASESPYKWFVKNEFNYFHSISEGITNDAANNGRQEFPTVYIPDGYVDVLRTDYIIKNKLLHGDKMLSFVSPNCNEVDTESDFKLLEYQIEKEKSKLYDYMIKEYCR